MYHFFTVYMYIYKCIISAIRGQDSGKLVPCFTADVVLSLPNIVSNVHMYKHVHVHTFMYSVHDHVFLMSIQVIQPSLEDIQNAVNTAVQCITDVGQYVHIWSIPSPASSLSNTPRSNDSKYMYYMNILITCTFMHIRV